MRQRSFPADALETKIDGETLNLDRERSGPDLPGDATSHAPHNIGRAPAESIVVEFKNREKAR